MGAAHKQILGNVYSLQITHTTNKRKNEKASRLREEEVIDKWRAPFDDF